ncbi:hypothetical protein STLA111740_12715 [Stenotrophomonas lactitubi]
MRFQGLHGNWPYDPLKIGINVELITRKLLRVAKLRHTKMVSPRNEIVKVCARANSFEVIDRRKLSG